jgi:hypothetical protein
MKYQLIKFLTILFLSSSLLLACNKIAFSPDPKSDPIAVYDYFINDFKNNYALFELKGINPDTFGVSLRKFVSDKTSDSDLFKIIGYQAQTVRDRHVFVSNLYNRIGYNVAIGVPVNRAVNLSRYVLLNSNGKIRHETMRESTLGYIVIPSFSGKSSDFEAIDDAIDKFSSKKGIIIDVRNNLGGGSQNAEIVASRFANKKVIYGKKSAKIGPNKDDFTPWTDLYIEPLGKSQFLKPVVVLTNRSSFSATEWFLMMMQNFPNVRIVGDTTSGGLSSSAPRELPNGWIYKLSTQRIIRPDGSTPEGKGIIPNYTVWISQNDVAQGRDKILEKAIELLK